MALVCYNAPHAFSPSGKKRSTFLDSYGSRLRFGQDDVDAPKNPSLSMYSYS